MSHRPVVLTADLHLRKRTWSKRQDLEGDTYYALKQIVDLCLKHQADLLLAGDTFNSPHPDAEDVRVLQDHTDKLVAAGLSVFAIDGNHDRSRTSWSTICKGVTCVDSREFQLGPYVAYGLNYYPPNELQHKLLQVPARAQFLVCHQLLDLFFNREGAYNMQASWVPPTVKWVLIGDYHVTCQETKNGTIFYSPGSSAMQKQSEATDKWVYLLRDDANNLERVPLLTRNVIDFNLGSTSDFGRLKVLIGKGDHRLPEGLRKPIVRLHYDPKSANVSSFLTELEAETHLWAHAIASWDSTTSVVDRPRVSGDILSTLTAASKVPKLYEFVSELLTVTEVAPVLESWKTKMMNST